jgi:hypothetical protein
MLLLLLKFLTNGGKEKLMKLDSEGNIQTQVIYNLSWGAGK